MHHLVVHNTKRARTSDCQITLGSPGQTHTLLYSDDDDNDDLIIASCRVHIIVSFINSGIRLFKKEAERKIYSDREGSRSRKPQRSQSMTVHPSV